MKWSNHHQLPLTLRNKSLHHVHLEDQREIHRKWCESRYMNVWDRVIKEELGIIRRSRTRWVMHWRKWTKHGTFYLFNFGKYLWGSFILWVEGEKRKHGRTGEQENGNCPRKPIPHALSVDFLKAVLANINVYKIQLPCLLKCRFLNLILGILYMVQWDGSRFVHFK